MKKYLLVTAILGMTFLLADGQTKKKAFSGAKFTSAIQAGILEGESDKSFGQFQIVNGIQQNAWFYGLGLGIDYYGSKRSVPVFFDVKRDIIKGKRTPYVYADAGYNFSWLRDKDKTAFWGNDYKEKGGLFYETGLGYKFILKNKIAVGLSAGYSFKQQKEMFTRFIINDFPPYNQPGVNLPPEVYDYKFRRISIKFNCSF